MDNPKYRPNDKTFLARIRPFISNILIRDGMMDVKSEMIARMTGMLKEENILQSVKLGLWTLELDTVNGKNRLYVDKSMRSILGIDDIMNSEEYFRFWYDNILSLIHIFANSFKTNYDAGGIDAVIDNGMKELLVNADITMVNEEFPFSNRGTQMEDKQYTFRTDPSYAAALKEMAVDLSLIHI